METNKTEKSGIKEVAFQYWQVDLNVVPVEGKTPLINWKKWQTEQQSVSDFEKLPWNEANGFALIGGSRTADGLHICAVDLDVKNLPEEVIKKGRQVIEKLPATQTESTPSGGLHLIYLSKRKPKTISSYHNLCALELLGENKLIIMAPSQGYAKLNFKSPMIVENLEEIFMDAIDEFGNKVTKDNCANYSTKFWFGREDLACKPYVGENPPCIRHMEKGVEEGLRSEALIRFSSFLVNFRQEDPQKALRRVRNWNNFNDPPLEKKELEKTFKSALHGCYNYGCRDPVLKSFCSPASCPLRKEKEEIPEETKLAFDAETEKRIEDEVERIQKAENQLEAIAPHLANIIVGEDVNKKVIFVLLIGSKHESPKMKQIIVPIGEAGGGKSRLANLSRYGYKVKNVGRFTAHALDYSDVAGYDILYIKELPRLNEEKFGVSTIKFLSGDDEGYYVEYTIRDETTGRMMTERRHIPPMTLVSTSTNLVFDPQFDRRIWKLDVDDSPEQTEKVLEWKAKLEKQEAQKKMGFIKITDYEFSGAVIERFVERLKPVKIVIPFPLTITKMFSKKILRLRSDIDKVYAFLELYGQLNVKRLWRVKEEIYALTPNVAVEALNIIEGVILKMLAKLETRTQQILEALNEITVETGQWTQQKFTGEEPRKIKTHRNIEGSKITKDVRAKLAVYLGISDDTVRVRLNALASAGYVNSDKRKGRLGTTFTLLYDVSEILQKLKEESGILQSPNSLMCEMEKEARNFLSSECGIQLEMGESEISSSVDSIKDGKIPDIAIPKHSPHLNSKQNQEDSEEKPLENAENKENFISKEKVCDDVHTKVIRDWCPICGSSEDKHQRKIRLPPWKDEVYAHEFCYREYHVEGKPWWEYAREREMREA